MKEFATGHIRNVALVAHHGVGKTSLAEAMLYQAKATTRIGRIADGSTMLDHSPEEISRQITIDLPEGFACFVEQWPAFKGRSVSELAGEMITAHGIVTSWQEMVRAFRARNDNA